MKLTTKIQTWESMRIAAAVSLGILAASTANALALRRRQGGRNRLQRSNRTCQRYRPDWRLDLPRPGTGRLSACHRIGLRLDTVHFEHPA